MHNFVFYVYYVCLLKRPSKKKLNTFLTYVHNFAKIKPPGLNYLSLYGCPGILIARWPVACHDCAKSDVNQYSLTFGKSIFTHIRVGVFWK